MRNLKPETFIVTKDRRGVGGDRKAPESKTNYNPLLKLLWKPKGFKGFRALGERASDSFSAENGRQPRKIGKQHPCSRRGLGAIGKPPDKPYKIKRKDPKGSRGRSESPLEGTKLMGRQNFGGFGGGANMQQLMKQAQKMQQQLQEAQEQLDAAEY